MSKILLFSDLHCHAHKNQISRLEDCLKALKWVFDTAKKHNITDVVFAGDLFQERQKIFTIAYEKTFHVIQEYFGVGSKMKLYLLVGNHDMWYSDQWSVTSIDPFMAIENVQVINHPCSMKLSNGCIVDFLPYTKNPIKDIETYFPQKNDILVSHCSVDGAKLNSLYNTKAEISVEYEGDMVKVGVNAFDGWKRVFLGHYHCAQKLNDVVEYIGSPLELNFGEAFQQKHIIIYDHENNDTEYVINEFSPKHMIVKAEEIDNHDLDGNFVQVVVEDITATDIIEIKKNIKERGHRTVVFTEKERKKEDDGKQTEIKEKLNLAEGDILERWIKAKNPEDLLFDKLLAIGQDIVSKA